jgi:hypothetical protein
MHGTEIAHAPDVGEYLYLRAQFQAIHDAASAEANSPNFATENRSFLVGRIASLDISNADYSGIIVAPRQSNESLPTDTPEL